MDKVAIYCRLSDEDKDKNCKFDESESIQNQKTLLTKYAIEKEWAIYKIYSDDDYSGLDLDRPEFNQMLKDAKVGKFNIVLCKHQSRFSRDIEVVEKYLHRKFPEWGIRFVSLTDYVDTLDEANKKSRQINSLVNEWYCEDISKAIRATFKVKREEGKFIGSFAPYGYKKDPKNRNKLLIDEKAAMTVRQIFNWYLEGHGTQHIAYMLNEQGNPNPTRHKQNKGLKYKNSSQTDSYGLWSKTTIRRILRNEVYIGNTVQGKREKVNYKSKKIIIKDKEDWIAVDGTHEPIIDYDTFNAVQRRLNDKARSTGEGKPHIFAGKVTCMDCKSSMSKVKAGRYEYLRCKLYTRDPKKRLCTSHSIRLDVLKDLASEKIREQINKVENDSLAMKLRQECSITNNIKLLEQKLKQVEKDIKEQNNILENLYIDKVKEVISNEQFNLLNEKFINVKDRLLSIKHKVENEIEVAKGKLENLDRWKDIVMKYKDFKDINNIMVNKLIDSIEVGKRDTQKQSVKIHWTF